MRLQLKFHAHSISTHTHRPLVSGADRAICQDVAPRLTRPPRNGITLTRLPPSTHPNPPPLVVKRQAATPRAPRQSCGSCCGG